jgi:hypothetical protein
MDEDSIWPKLLRGAVKTAIVLGAVAGILWSLDQEEVFNNVMMTLGACYFLWGVLFDYKLGSLPGIAYVYGADGHLTRRPLMTFHNHSLEGAVASAKRYVSLRQSLSETSEKFPMPAGGLIASEVDASSTGKKWRVAAFLGGLLVFAAGALFFVSNGPWQVAVMAVAALMAYWRWMTKARYGFSYVYRRFTDGPVASFQSYSTEQAWELAWQYVAECKAMAEAGLMHANDADLQVMHSGSVRRGSKDWPWQEDTSKK